MGVEGGGTLSFGKLALNFDTSSRTSSSESVCHNKARLGGQGNPSVRDHRQRLDGRCSRHEIERRACCEEIGRVARAIGRTVPFP